MLYDTSYFGEHLVPYSGRLGLVVSIASIPASYAGYLSSNTGPRLAIVTCSHQLFLIHPSKFWR
jgi:hypothetical protein